jgi:hypothetical protein
MTVDPARSLNVSSLASVCPHCGGSGTLRLSGQRYRTCLPCLGQGQTPSLESAITTAKLAALRAEALRNATQCPAGEISPAEFSPCELSGAASGAAAR